MAITIYSVEYIQFTKQNSQHQHYFQDSDQAYNIFLINLKSSLEIISNFLSVDFFLNAGQTSHINNDQCFVDYNTFWRNLDTVVEDNEGETSNSAINVRM